MPPEKERRLYWDANCFIYLLDSSGEKYRDRRDIAKAILNDARLGDVKLITSTFSRAEVRKSSGHPTLTRTQHQEISEFFKHSFIEMRAVTRRIADLAAELGERYGLSPTDAVHLATAVEAGVQEFQSWDGDFFEGQFRDKNQTPPVKIAKPTWAGNIQQPLFKGDKPRVQPRAGQQRRPRRTPG